MAEPFIFIGTHTVKEGKLEGFKQHVHEFCKFVEAQEPRLIHFKFYFNEDGGARGVSTLPTDYWFLHSHDGGATWNETRVTPTSFDLERAPVARGYFLGDYAGLAVRAGGFAAAFPQMEATDPASVFVRQLAP